jgi:hypothetical protein
MKDKEKQENRPKPLTFMGKKEDFEDLTKFIKGHPECGPLLNELLGGFNGRKT